MRRVVYSKGDNYKGYRRFLASDGSGMIALTHEIL